MPLFHRNHSSQPPQQDPRFQLPAEVYVAELRQRQAEEAAARVPVLLLPEPAEDVQRERQAHAMLRLLLSGPHNSASPLHVAPLPHTGLLPMDVLDVGCGASAFWARDMATTYGQARITAVDIVAPLERLGTPDLLPPNMRRLVGNIYELPLPNVPFGSFDYVHMAFMSIAIRERQWRDMLSSVSAYARDGGIVELLEPGTPINAGEMSSQLMDWIGRASAQHGVLFPIDRGLNERRLRQLLFDTLVFPEVFDYQLIVPISANPLRVEHYSKQLAAAGYFAYLRLVTACKSLVIASGVASQTEYEAALFHLGEDLRHHPGAQWPWYSVWGQLPSYDNDSGTWPR